jgi:flavodoxin
MAKTLVTYFSRTGNTKLVAEAIFGALSGEKMILPMAEAGDLSAYRLVFAGFPVQTHSVPYPVEVFLKSIPEGKKVALFSTHGSVAGSDLSRQAIEYAAVLVGKTQLLGTFSCRGKVSVRALEVLAQSPEHEAWPTWRLRRRRTPMRATSRTPRPSPAGSRPSPPKATTAAFRPFIKAPGFSQDQ